MSDQQHISEHLENYQLLQLLGNRGYTEVYLGEHIHQHTLVAIKFIKGRATADEVAKFLAQARNLTRLQHPHIVPIHDFGVRDGIPYLVMSYISNGHLRQRHPKGSRIPLNIVISYVKQVASALQYVHQHHLVHRDIKPHNMLVGPNNEIMLSDFGIAVISHSIDHLQSDLLDFEGTVPYAAPEQLQGAARRSCDQYSLGIVVYEWLTGTWPFSGSFEEIVQQHLFDPPPSLREQGIELPPLVEQVIMKSLAKEPADRFQDVEAFAAALERASNITSTHHKMTATSQAQARRQFMPPLPFSKERMASKVQEQQ